MWNFNPRSPHGERLLEQTREIKVTAISIHAPRTGSDRYAIEDILRLQISIHAPRTGSDVRKLKALTRDEFAFQSTLPARGATSTSRIYLLYWSFQSTLPARGATVSLDTLVGRDEFQSTLPARGATKGGERVMLVIPISIHAPRTGSDELGRVRAALVEAFQSTLPARGATGFLALPLCINRISIHAPRTGSDIIIFKAGCLNVISIHAPRTGSDFIGYHLQDTIYYFNPRSPHGERHAPSCVENVPKLFQSTLPARGATRDVHPEEVEIVFQSTLPARGATALANPQRSGEDISIHAPRTGSDRYHSTLRVNPIYFNPRSPHGERHEKIAKLYKLGRFQSTLPARGATAAPEEARPSA